MSSSTKLQIGVIGSGNIGKALARHFRRIGHEVLLSNSRGPESLADVAKELDVKAVTSAEAAKAKDVVVVTIPMIFTPKLKPLFEGVPSSVIVIDTNNYYPEMRDGPIDEIEKEQLDSVWVSKQIDRPVVKVFNSIMSKSLEEKGKPKGTEGRIALPVSGEPEKHRQRVMELVDAIGFDPVDNGDLSNSWRQQVGTPIYTKDLTADKVREGLASAEKSKLAEYRHAAEEMTIKAFPELAKQQQEAVKKHQK